MQNTTNTKIQVPENVRNIFWEKINSLIDDVNSKIETLLEEDKIKYLQKTFKKLIRLLKIKVKNWLKKEDIDEILTFIWHIFEIFNIKKIYNLDSINRLDSFRQLSLDDKFNHNILPYNWEHVENWTIPWWTCNSWAIFFDELMELFWDLIEEKKLLKYGWNCRHASLYVKINWKEFLIDPFAKAENILNEIQIWWDIYIWTSFNKPIFWKIKSINPFIIESNWEDIECEYFQNVWSFIETLNPPESIITQVRTYRKWEKIDLIIKKSQDWSNFILQFNNIRENWYLPILKIDVEEVIKNPESTSYDILLKFFWEDSLSQDDKEKLEYISTLVDKESLISQILN